MKIYEMMNKAGLTMTQLADRLDVSVPTVYNWCNGKIFPSAKNLPRLADALHCTIDDLFGR